MHLTGRLSRQRPWWLLFGVLAYVLLFTVSSAAPLNEHEIQPAPEEAVASISQNHRAPSFQAAEALPDSRVSRSTSSAGFSFPKPPDSFTFSAQAAPRPVKPLITLSERHMTRMQRFKAILQRLAVKKFTNWISRYQQFKRRSKAKKFGPRRGEVEIKPVYKLSEEEVKRGGPPKPRMLSRAEELEVFNALKPYHRASYEAFIRTGTSFEPDPKVLAAELRRQPTIEKARTERLAAEAHARALAAGVAGESSRPLRAFEPTAHQDTAAEARVLPVVEDGAGVSIRPLQAAEHASQVEPHHRTSISQRVVTLSRTPSSNWDRMSLEKQAEKRLEQGLAVISDALHAEALPRVHLRKRSPPGVYEYAQTHNYPGQHYHIMLIQDETSRDPTVKEGKLSYRLIDPAYARSDEPSMAKYWDELSHGERKIIHQAFKKPVVGWFSHNDYREEPTERVKSLPSDANGFRRINVPGKGPITLRGYRDGLGNWRWESRVDPDRAVPLVHEDNLPEHLKDFVRNALGDDRSSGSRARGRSNWARLSDLRYQGEGYQVVQGPNGKIQFARWSPHKDQRYIPNYFDELGKSEQRNILKTIPAVKQLRKNGWDLGKVSSELRISRYPEDPTGAYYFPGREAHNIKVERNGNRFKFEIMKETPSGAPQRMWVALDDLPNHMKDFLRWQASADGQTRLPWGDILSGLRRRSLPSLRLKKRAGSADPSTSEPILLTYPKQKLEIRKPPSGYIFSVLSDDSVTQDFLTWPALTDDQKGFFRRAYPRIDDVVQNKLDERNAGLIFERDPVMPFQLATRTLPAESIWIVQESSPLSPGQKRLLFVRNHPATSSDYKTLQELPEYLQTWLYKAHRNIYIEAGGPIKEAKRPLSKSIPASNSDNIRPLASNSQHAASREKFAIKFHGNYIFTDKDLDGNYRFSTSNPTSSSEAFDYRLWTALSDGQKARVKKAIPHIERMVSADADASRSSLQPDRSRLGTGWQNEHRTHLISDERPETILVEKKQRWLPLRRPKFIFHRTDPATLRTISSSFKDLPDHLKNYLRNSYSQGFKDMIKHPLWKRADSPADVGTGQPIAFHYPGQEVEVRKIAGKYFFGFPSGIKNVVHTDFLPWDELSLEDRHRVQRAYLKIEAFIKGDIDEAAAHLDFEPGENPEVSIAHRIIYDEGPRTIWLIRKRHPFLRGREIMQFLQVDPITSRLAAVSMQKLPFPVQMWFYQTHRSVFDEAVESAKTYRLPLWRSGSPSGLSPKPLAPRSKFFRFEFQGQQVKIHKLKNNGGYSYGMKDDAYPDKEVWNKPWTDLSAEQKDRFRAAVPDIENLVNKEADAKDLGLKFRFIGIDYPTAIVRIPGQEPESILLEEQKQGWLPFSRRKKLIFHRFDPKTSGTISSSMEELPNHLRDYFRNNYSQFFEKTIKYPLRKRAGDDDIPYMPLPSDPEEASSSKLPAGADKMQRIDYPGQVFHIHEPSSGNRYVFSFPSVAWPDSSTWRTEWEALSQEQRAIVLNEIPEIKRFLENPTEEAKAKLKFQPFAAERHHFKVSTHSIASQRPETIFVESPTGWLTDHRLRFHRLEQRDKEWKPWMYEDLAQHIKDYIEARYLYLHREALGLSLSGLRPRKRSITSDSDGEVPRHELPSSSNQAVSNENRILLEYPGRKLLLHDHRGKLSFSFPVDANPDLNNNMGWQRWEGLNGEQHKWVKDSIEGIERYHANPTEDFRNRFTFKDLPVGDDIVKTATIQIKGLEPQRFWLERRRTALRTKWIFHQLDSDGKSYNKLKLGQLPKHVRGWFEAQYPAVFTKVSKSASTSFLRPWKRRGLTPGISDPNYTYEKLPSGPDQASSSEHAASRPDVEVFDVPATPAIPIGRGRRIAGIPAERVMLERKSSFFPPWKKYLLFRFWHRGFWGKERKFEELPQFVIEYLRKQHNDVFREALTLSGIEYTPSMHFKGGVYTIDYPGEEIQLVRTQDGMYKFNFQTPGGRRLLRSRTWSTLPEDVKQHFLKIDGNIKKLVKGTMSFEQAQEKGVLVLQEPTREKWAYEHPFRPGFTFNIGRSTENEIVIKQLDSYNQYRFRSKFMDLPDHLKQFLWEDERLHKLLFEAVGSAPRLRKRAPPNLPLLHTVNYPGEKITLTKAYDGTYVFNFLRPDGLSIYRSKPWNKLPDDLKESLAEIPHLPEVAQSRMSVDEAREKPVLVATHSFDLTQAHSHPLRPTEEIKVRRNGNEIVFQRILRHRVAAPVEYSSLPEYLQDFLWGKEEIRRLLQQAGESAGRLHKRMLP